MQSYWKDRTNLLPLAEMATRPLFLNGPITRVRQKRTF